MKLDQAPAPGCPAGKRALRRQDVTAGERTAGAGMPIPRRRLRVDRYLDRLRLIQIPGIRRPGDGRDPAPRSRLAVRLPDSGSKGSDKITCPDKPYAPQSIVRCLRGSPLQCLAGPQLRHDHLPSSARRGRLPRLAALQDQASKGPFTPRRRRTGQGAREGTSRQRVQPRARQWPGSRAGAALGGVTLTAAAVACGKPRSRRSCRPEPGPSPT